MNKINFEIKIRPFVDLGDGACQNERIYFDFKVSGILMSELLKTEKYDMIGAISKSDNKEYEFDKIEEFILEREPELELGRTIIYGCAECLDVYCGAITAKIEQVGTIVKWHSFGYENGFGEIHYEKYKEIGPFEFDKVEYLTIFEKIKNAILH